MPHMQHGGGSAKSAGRLPADPDLYEIAEDGTVRLRRDTKH
jgi:hypothetical protein